MRVLHMIPDIGIANGIMSVILNYAKAMPDDIKFDVVYFAENERDKREEIEALGGRVYKINAPSPKGLLKGEMDCFFNAHKGEWEALHINAPHFAVFIAPSAKRAGIKRICCHCHSTEFSLKGNSGRNKLLSLYAKYFVKDKFACSKNAGDFWYGGREYGIIKNAIDCERFRFDDAVRASKRTELQLNDKLVVAHIGRTDIPQKNHGFILEVFNELSKLNENSVLLLIGAEPTDGLKAYCIDKVLTDKVMFLGLRSDISELLAASDVFLFPSTDEGLPVSVVEAQASGLPVLMSDSVTDEVLITDVSQSMSLTAPPSEWAAKLYELSKLPRLDETDELIQSGWEITNAANLLAAYYRG